MLSSWALCSHALIHSESVGVCPKPSPRVPSLPSSPPCSLRTLPRNKRSQPALAAKLKRRSNVSGAVHPFHQGEGGGRLGRTPAPRMPVLRGDQELQGGGPHSETCGASAVATTTDATQDAGSVHSSHPVAASDAREARCSTHVAAADTTVS